MSRFCINFSLFRLLRQLRNINSDMRTYIYIYIIYHIIGYCIIHRCIVQPCTSNLLFDDFSRHDLLATCNAPRDPNALLCIFLYWPRLVKLRNVNINRTARAYFLHNLAHDAAFQQVEAAECQFNPVSCLPYQ